jgi:lipoprotein-anchoring transpeptidase ErfK/SrfK
MTRRLALCIVTDMLQVALLMWMAFGAVALAQTRGSVAATTETVRSTATVTPMLAAQVMLDAAGFSVGEIDGKAGANFARAVGAFQKSRGLGVSGRVNDATWARLQEEFKNQPPLVVYTITDADVAGPFQPAIPADLIEQSKLSSLDYRNALEAIAERFHASPKLLQSLNPNQTFAKAGDQIQVPNVTPGDVAPVATDAAGVRGIRIVVSKRTSALTVEDATGRVRFFAPVTTGSQHDPLPIGKWKVTAVQQSPVFHYNPRLFWDADRTDSKARIPAGPNNPVGVAWIDISKPHYGIHGTPEPSTVGHVQSHGCVRMTNWDVRRVLEWVKPGTPVVFQ